MQKLQSVKPVLPSLLVLGLCLAVGHPVRAEVTTYALPNASNTAGGIAVDIEGNVYTADFGGTQLFQITPNGTVSVFATGLTTPSGNAFDSKGNLYQSNYGANVPNDTITKIAPDGTATTFASNLSGPVGIAIDSNDTLYVAMCDVNNVTRITQGGSVDVFSFSNTFQCPNGITFDEEGSLYVVNFRDGGVTKVDRDGAPTAFANLPGGGNGHVAYVAGHLYVADRVGNQIYRVDIETADVELFAGTGSNGTVDGPNFDAGFSQPNGIVRNPEGSLLFTNENANAVRRIDLDLARPDKPKSLKAKSRKKGKAKLTWSHDSFNREGFAIELSTDGGKFEEVGRVASTATKATLKGLEAGVNYKVRLRTFNGTRSSKPSKKVKFKGKS